MKERTILLVEDNKLVLEVASYVLRKNGFSISVCENVPDAIKTLNDLDSVDLLFTDVLLPEGRVGTEVAKVAWSKMPNLPVLFTSGYSKDEMTQELLQQEQVCFLPKPYKPGQLLEAVNKLLGDTVI